MQPSLFRRFGYGNQLELAAAPYDKNITGLHMFGWLQNGVTASLHVTLLNDSDRLFPALSGNHCRNCIAPKRRHRSMMFDPFPDGNNGKWFCIRAANAATPYLFQRLHQQCSCGIGRPKLCFSFSIRISPMVSRFSPQPNAAPKKSRCSSVCRLE